MITDSQILKHQYPLKLVPLLTTQWKRINLDGKLFILALVFSLSACTSSSSKVELGYWLKGFTPWSQWQCVESTKPHRNKEC